MTSFYPADKKYMGNTDYFRPNKIQEGEEVRIRIMSPAIMGWEDWTADKKPVRFRPREKPLTSINPDKKVKEFTAMVVWNYDLERTQIWSFTQVGVANSLEKMVEKKGDPMNYDIKIGRIGEDEHTRYILLACAPTPIPKVAVECLKAVPINLQALYSGKDPWTYPEELEERDERDNDSDVA